MKKYWFGLIIFIVVGLLFIYKDSLYMSEKVYIIYKKNNFYKNKYKDIYYYKKKEQVLELTSFENKKVLKENYQKIKNLNIITIDSLSKILPLNFYTTHLLSKEKLDRLKRLRIFVVEIDSTKNKINIKEVYQSFSEE